MIEFNFSDYGQINTAIYQKEQKKLLIELAKLQKWIISENKKVAVVFEGRDTAGKTRSISTLSKYLIPKFYRLVNLGPPNLSESKRWFKRYEKHLPSSGEIVFFDRSWYTRALVEATMNYCTKRQYLNFMNKVVDWEKEYINKNTEIIKIYLSIEKKTQLKRIKNRVESPLVYWKISDNDFKMLEKWDVFTFYKDQMFSRTSHSDSPWIVINANNKRIAGLNALRYILNHFNYPNKNLPKPKEWSLGLNNYEVFINKVKFDKLSYEQYKTLMKLKGS
jgi:polyphosphate kinase 2